MSESKEIKGAKFTIGDSVQITIKQGNGTTTIYSIISGIQFWNPSLIAIQVVGIHEWIQLNDNTEIMRRA